jgi:hypothetical protein
MTTVLLMLFLCAYMMKIEGTNLSHERCEINFESGVQTIKAKIEQRGNLPYVSVERQLEILKELAQCDLGRFLLDRGGLNGYWTDYIVHYPERGRLTGLSSRGTPCNFIEGFMLNRAPFALAMQQRFQVFKREIQRRVQEDVVMASVPCGLMGDLLDLDYSAIAQFSLCGIDLDPEAIEQAKAIARTKGLEARCQFAIRDAWQLEMHEVFDLIASNGLSIYEPNENRVVALYRQFFEALKPGGCLVTSFLTPPPAPGVKTEWDLQRVNQSDALLQKILFMDILPSKWQAFRSQEQVEKQLREAGFSDLEIHYDEAHVFPTIIAKKSL